MPSRCQLILTDIKAVLGLAEWISRTHGGVTHISVQPTIPSLRLLRFLFLLLFLFFFHIFPILFCFDSFFLLDTASARRGARSCGRSCTLGRHAGDDGRQHMNMQRRE